MKYKIINNCQICKNKLIKFLDLGKQPLCDDLTIKPNKSNFYKLQVLYCKKCLTAFQKYNIQKKILFPKNYHYRSANTKDVVDGMKDLVKSTKKYVGNLKDKIVLDIGCNDGTLLDLFRKESCKTIGIEPTGAFKDAKKKGHKIYNRYFDLSAAKLIIKEQKKIDIITFTNVFAHIENLQNLLISLKKIISKDTLIIIENHYLGEVIKKNQFDTFYHEHPRTYSLRSFVNIANILNVSVVDYKFVKRYNGNIRVYLRKFGKILKSKNQLKDSLRFEKKDILEIKKFQKKVNIWKINKIKLFNKLIKHKGPLPAKAFPGRASILLRLLNLNNNYITNIYEKNNSLKTNKYAPGTNIKIIKDKFLNNKERKKKVIINLAWHINKEIKVYLKKKLNYKGKIIDIISKSDFK